MFEAFTARSREIRSGVSVNTIPPKAGCGQAILRSSRIPAIEPP
jgi:hypothetical protein